MLKLWPTASISPYSLAGDVSLLPQRQLAIQEAKGSENFQCKEWERRVERTAIYHLFSLLLLTLWKRTHISHLLAIISWPMKLMYKRGAAGKLLPSHPGYKQNAVQKEATSWLPTTELTAELQAPSLALTAPRDASYSQTAAHNSILATSLPGAMWRAVPAEQRARLACGCAACSRMQDELREWFLETNSYTEAISPTPLSLPFHASLALTHLLIMSICDGPFLYSYISWPITGF